MDSTTHVPGAMLRDRVAVKDHSNMELRRWLECRGLKKVGTKPELIERVINCINAGRADIIFLGIDGGKWYDFKTNVSATPGNSSSIRAPDTSNLQFMKFPSVKIPEYFNKGHIYTYIAGPQVENDDYELDSVPGITEKPFRRGSQYVSSDYIHELHNTVKANIYYLKGKCYSSFQKKNIYNVQVTLNALSGAVVNGSCECKQSALGKCSHVSALLLFLWKCVKQHGHDGLSTTSKLREWGLGSKQKNPGPVPSKYYPCKRAKFDPRPNNYTRCININDFICNVQKITHQTIFETLIKLQYEDFEVDEEYKTIIKNQVRQFYNGMKLFMNSYQSKIFEIKGTEVQGTPEWLKWRTYFFTSSVTKTAVSLNSPSAKSNYLKKYLWLLSPNYVIPSLIYGRKCEPKARKSYIENCLEVGESVAEVGLYVNMDYPHLACSVDGVVMKDNKIIRIIEIKCPKLLENKNVLNFANILTKQQKSSFFLYENDGEVQLKPHHPYLYQVVTSMLIHNVTECDFVVWSHVNMVVIKIKMDVIDPKIVYDLTVKLKHLYYNMYVPEMFFMRIPRNLQLCELEF